MNAAEILALVQDDGGGFDDDVADPDYEDEDDSDSDSEEETLVPSAQPTKRLEPTKRSAFGQTSAPGPSKKLRVAADLESDPESDSGTLLFFDPPEERPDADTDRDSGTSMI